MNYAELGYRIRQAREEARLSQDVVAQHLGITRSAVSLIENGKRKVDTLELRSFSQLVGKSVAFFLDDNIVTANTLPSEPSEDKDPIHILFSANQVVDISPDCTQIQRFSQFHQEFGYLARMLNRLPKKYSTEPRYNIYKPTPAAARWMANQERARLGLPLSSPIHNMLPILQSQGIRVMAWDLKTPNLGGCFIFSPILGSFVLVKHSLTVLSANAINFILAHEYCHDLIHRQHQGLACNPSKHYRKPEEYFAQWFAANFLMPEEALVPYLNKYLELNMGIVTGEIVMNLALDFGVSYTAMLNRMATKGVELIDSQTREQLGQEKVSHLLVKIGRSIPHFEIKKFPIVYVDMVFEAYSLGYISLGKLAELLDLPIEEAKVQLEKRNMSIELCVSSEDELLRDLTNA